MRAVAAGLCRAWQLCIQVNQAHALQEHIAYACLLAQRCRSIQPMLACSILQEHTASLPACSLCHFPSGLTRNVRRNAACSYLPCHCTYFCISSGSQCKQSETAECTGQSLTVECIGKEQNASKPGALEECMCTVQMLSTLHHLSLPTQKP